MTGLDELIGRMRARSASWRTHKSFQIKVDSDLVRDFCDAQAAIERMQWQGMDSAPKDGTLLLLLVEANPFETTLCHATENARIYRTIGSNSRANDGEDVWTFAGWCWDNDHYTDGEGTPIGWAHLPPRARTPARPEKG